MLNVKVVCIGKLKEKCFTDACAEYTKRLGAFCCFTVMELPEERLPENPSPAVIAAALEKEGARILSAAGGAALIALCVEGKKASSEAFSEYLSSLALSGISSVCFAIGSSYGLSEAVKEHARLRLSVSDMTFPHQLFRVMLFEQIYRAFQIMSNGKYHK